MGFGCREGEEREGERERGQMGIGGARESRRVAAAKLLFDWVPQSARGPRSLVGFLQPLSESRDVHSQAEKQGERKRERAPPLKGFSFGASCPARGEWRLELVSPLASPSRFAFLFGSASPHSLCARTAQDSERENLLVSPETEEKREARAREREREHRETEEEQRTCREGERERRESFKEEVVFCHKKKSLEGKNSFCLSSLFSSFLYHRVTDTYPCTRSRSGPASCR